MASVYDDKYSIGTTFYIKRKDVFDEKEIYFTKIEYNDNMFPIKKTLGNNQGKKYTVLMQSNLNNIYEIIGAKTTFQLLFKKINEKKLGNMTNTSFNEVSAILGLYVNYSQPIESVKQDIKVVLNNDKLDWCPDARIVYDNIDKADIKTINKMSAIASSTYNFVSSSYNSLNNINFIHNNIDKYKEAEELNLYTNGFKQNTTDCIVYNSTSSYSEFINEIKSESVIVDETTGKCTTKSGIDFYQMSFKLKKHQLGKIKTCFVNKYGLSNLEQYIVNEILRLEDNSDKLIEYLDINIQELSKKITNDITLFQSLLILLNDKLEILKNKVNDLQQLGIYFYDSDFENFRYSNINGELSEHQIHLLLCNLAAFDCIIGLLEHQTDIIIDQKNIKQSLISDLIDFYKEMTFGKTELPLFIIKEGQSPLYLGNGSMYRNKLKNELNNDTIVVIRLEPQVGGHMTMNTYLLHNFEDNEFKYVSIGYRSNNDSHYSFTIEGREIVPNSKLKIKKHIK